MRNTRSKIRNIITKSCLALSLPLALALTAPSAQAADGFGFSLSKYGKHGGVQVSIGNHGYGRSYGRNFGHYPRRAPRKSWTPGHYQVHYQKVWIPGATRKVWIEPVYETRYDSCGRPVQVQVSSGYWDTICEPGFYEQRPVKTWRPGYWSRGRY